MGGSPGAAGAQHGGAIPLHRAARSARDGLVQREGTPSRPRPMCVCPPPPATSARPLPARCLPLKPPAGLPRPARAPRAPQPAGAFPPARCPPPPASPRPRSGARGREGGAAGAWRENDQGPRAAPERSARLMLPARRPRRTKAALRLRLRPPPPRAPRPELASWRDINELALFVLPRPLSPPTARGAPYISNPPRPPRAFRGLPPPAPLCPPGDGARRKEDTGHSPRGPPGPPRAAAAATAAAAGGGGSPGPGAVPHASQRPTRSVGHGDGGIFAGGFDCGRGGCRSRDSWVHCQERVGSASRMSGSPAKPPDPRCMPVLAGLGGKCCPWHLGTPGL